MNIKLNILLTALLFFLLPFIYFYAASRSHFELLLYPEIIYPFFFLIAIFFAYYIEKNLRHELQTEPKKKFLIVAGTCVILYAIYILGVTWYMYINFFSQGIDLEYFHQTIWQLSEFKIPYIWGLNQPFFPVWSQHFSPILYLLVPIFWLSHSAGLLLMVQAIAVISGAMPIYLLAKRFLHSKGIGLALSFAYLTFDGLQFGVEYGFHEIMFFPVLFLWSYYFYLCKKTNLYLLFVLLSLLVKEEVAFIMLFWGIYLFIIKRDRLIGSITAAMGICWYFLCFLLMAKSSFGRGTCSW